MAGPKAKPPKAPAPVPATLRALTAEVKALRGLVDDLCQFVGF